METQERNDAIEHLNASEARLLTQVDGLTSAQWTFKEAPERWSIAETIEHCVLIEHGILSAIKRALDKPAAPEKRAIAEARKANPQAMREASSRKLDAPAPFLPQGKWSDTGALVAALRSARATTLQFAAESNADLNEHFFPHFMFGEMSCYEWLMLLGHHLGRHGRQINQIKQAEGYPA